MGEFIADLHRWFSDEIIEKTCTIKRRNYIIPGRSYYMGVDIARMGEDEGTIEIIDRIDSDTFIHVESIVTRKKLTTETEENIIKTDRLYDCKKIYLDAGAGTLGVSVLDHLLKNSSTRDKVIALNNRARPLDKDKTSTQKLLKEDLYGILLSLMEQGKVQLLDDEDIIESLKSVQYEYCMKEGQPTRLKIFGNYTHIVEGLIRAVFCSQDKDLKLHIYYI